MIERQQTMPHSPSRPWWQAAFALLLTAVIVVSAAPEASANALYLLTDGLSTVVAGAERVDSDRIVMAGANGTDTDVILESGKKVTIRQGGHERYATSRSGERVSALLQRESVSVGPLEMVRVDVSGEEIVLDIASSFTYYETVAEAASFQTVYTTDYTLPKGETRLIQPGMDGEQNVTYEVVYADGALVSRQAVAVDHGTVVDAVVSRGTLVTEAQPGDAIASVVENGDGSGYLLLESGDSLHFTGIMEATCTAYTTGRDRVGTITYTGTTVHVGVVAVDKNVIPLGTEMFITTQDGAYTYGMGHAEDTGVRGNAVDLYMDTYEECKQFGRRTGIVYLLDARPDAE